MQQVRQCEEESSTLSNRPANPTEMIRQGLPRLIHNDEELEEYTQALFALAAKPDPTPEEEEAVELMTLLVERYERERYQSRQPKWRTFCVFCWSTADSRSATSLPGWAAKAPSRWFFQASAI